MFDLSSSWVEGHCCELAAFGYSRDGKRGQVEYGLLTGPGRTVAVTAAVSRIRGDSGIERLVMAGDRGMITGTRIKDLRALDGMGWITTLKAQARAKHNAQGLPVYRYRDLLAHLATRHRQTIAFNGRAIEKLTTRPLGSRVPLTCQ